MHLQAEVHNSWADWLLLADAFGLRRLAGTMAQRVLKDMLACPAAWEQQQARLNGLGPHALGMLLDATHKAFSYKLAQVGHAGYRGSCGEYVPDLTSWRQFGDA